MLSKNQIASIFLPASSLKSRTSSLPYPNGALSMWEILTTFASLNSMPGMPGVQTNYLVGNGLEVGGVSGHNDDNGNFIVDSYTFYLGGSLVQNTSIYGAGTFQLNINSLSQFQLYTSNDINMYSEEGSVYLTSNSNEVGGAPQANISLGATGDVNITGGIITLDASDQFYLNCAGSIDLNASTVTVSEEFIANRLRGGGDAPSIALGTGAGTTPGGATVSGNTTSHTITIPTGTSPAGSNATIATLTFQTEFNVTPRVLLVPGNAAAAVLSGLTQVFTSDETTTTYLLKTGSTGLTGSTTYTWKAFVIG